MWQQDAHVDDNGGGCAVPTSLLICNSEAFFWLSPLLSPRSVRERPPRLYVHQLRLKCPNPLECFGENPSVLTASNLTCLVETTGSAADEPVGLCILGPWRPLYMRLDLLVFHVFHVD